MITKVVDSSCWIEIFTDGPLAKKCEKEVQSAESIAIPTLVIFEVYRKVKQATSDEKGLAVTSYLSQFDILPLTREVALLAAYLSLQYKLGTADSLTLAHAQEVSAQLVTLDNDFRKVPQVSILS